MPLKIARDTLIADTAVKNLIGDAIGPVQEMHGRESYVVLTQTGSRPVNSLDGFADLELCDVRVEAFAFTYEKAVEVANACRAALQNAGHQCVGHVGDQFEFQQDAGVFGYGHNFQIWK